MPFIPHTESETKAMLDEIGASSTDDLFSEIPDELKVAGLKKVPEGLPEMELARLMQEHAKANNTHVNYIGAGCYEHHIPAAVWSLVTRGEFLTAYTPYQAEASQGTLQLLYEYQTMMARLTGMDASNASLYDGGCGLAEAVLMAVRANRQCKVKRILMPATVHPNYRKVVKSIVSAQGIDLEELPYCKEAGITKLDSLSSDPYTALVIPQPNFFGCLESVDALTDAAHKDKALVIAVTNPTSLALLKPPSRWGKQGADIVCGDGQALGIPMSGGGPGFGFLTCKKAYVRQMPGRIVGRTVDADNNTAYVLTLQAREQHIRRSKATSNICTNQGLLVTAATIYMAIMGAHGLKQVASQSHHNLNQLQMQACGLDGVEQVFTSPTFHETVLRAPHADVLKQMNEHGIQAGYDLSMDYPELGNAFLVCATETKTDADIKHYCQVLQQSIIKKNSKSKVEEHADI